MASSVEFSESNGAGETVTDAITNANFGSADVPNLVTTSHPVIINTFSFRKYWRFHLTALGGSTQVDSLLPYKLSGAYVTGEQIFSNCPNNVNVWMNLSYATPDNSSLIANVEVINTTPTGPFLGIQNSSAGSFKVANGNVPGYSNYWVVQVKTTAATPVGPVNQKVLGIQYNEF